MNGIINKKKFKKKGRKSERASRLLPVSFLRLVASSKNRTSLCGASVHTGMECLPSGQQLGGGVFIDMFLSMAVPTPRSDIPALQDLACLPPSAAICHSSLLPTSLLTVPDISSLLPLVGLPK